MDIGEISHIVRWRVRRREQSKRIGPIGIFFRFASGLTGCGCLAVFLVVAMAVGLATNYYNAIAKELPDPEEIKIVEENFQTTRIYDRSGDVLLYELIDRSTGDRTWVPIEDISPYLICATVASEDKTFYTNPGFDFEGITRAFVDNLQGKSIQGGSSITQQLIKNVLISTEERYQQSYERKLKELILAVEITNKFTKDQILEWYLNTSFYGNLAHGTEAAAQVYFGKPARDLSLAEAAMLSPIPQYPHITPLAKDQDTRDFAKFRQGLVLTQILENGCEGVDVDINEAQIEAARSVELTYRSFEQRFDIVAPHFSTYVEQRLLELPGIDANRVYRGGLKVYTTIDLELQQQAECAARVHVARLQGKSYDEAAAIGGDDCVADDYLYPLPDRDVGVDHQVSNAAVLVLRPRTGEILAMVGSLDYWDENIDGKFNVAADGLRQPGSSFKPFTYVSLLGNPNYPDDPTLYNAATMFLDVYQSFPQASGIPYMPENYDRDYHGPQRLRLSLARSYNIPALEAMSLVGIDKVLRTAHAMGITTLDKGLDYYGLSLTLGGGEVKLMDMVYAFSVFANNGYMYGNEVLPADRRSGHRQLDPVSILRVEDREGNLLWEYTEPQSREVLDGRLAYLMNDIMSDRRARCSAFGCPNSLELNTEAGEVRPAVAKTGTTNNYVDAWTIGYTPQLAVGVWVGNTDSSPMKNTPGSKGAGPIWNAVMSFALRDEPIAPFVRPNGLVDMAVCGKSGLLPTAYCPTVVETFIPGTEPAEYDNIYKVFPINRETGKLATVHTPPELVENRVYEIYPPEAHDWVVTNGIEQPPIEWDTIDGSGGAVGDVAIGKPAPYSYINKPMVVEGNAKGGDFERYRLSFGRGLNPSAWIQIGGDHYNQVDNGPLEFWDISGFEDGLYTLQLTAVNHDQSTRQATIQVTIDTVPPTLDLNYPEDGSVYTYGDDEWVRINAEVFDNLSMDRVEFFVNNQAAPFAVRRIAPFNVRWTILGPGRYTFHVIACDAAGNMTKSGSTTVTIAAEQ